jgi:hypothetical protein
MTRQQSTRDEVRENLRRDAAELSVEGLISRVRAAVDSTVTAARSFDDAALAIPAGDGWTPLQCLSHVVESNVRHAQQILYVALSGELPPDAPFELPAGREELLAKHREAIESLFAHVREAAPDGFLHVTWPHAFFGELNWREWLLFLELHSIDHARQLAAMRGA